MLEKNDLLHQKYKPWRFLNNRRISKRVSKTRKKVMPTKALAAISSPGLH